MRIKNFCRIIPQQQRTGEDFLSKRGRHGSYGRIEQRRPETQGRRQAIRWILLGTAGAALVASRIRCEPDYGDNFQFCRRGKTLYLSELIKDPGLRSIPQTAIKDFTSSSERYAGTTMQEAVNYLHRNNRALLDWVLADQANRHFYVQEIKGLPVGVPEPSEKYARQYLRHATKFSEFAFDCPELDLLPKPSVQFVDLRNSGIPAKDKVPVYIALCHGYKDVHCTVLPVQGDTGLPDKAFEFDLNSPVIDSESEYTPNTTAQFDASGKPKIIQKGNEYIILSTNLGVHSLCSPVSELIHLSISDRAKEYWVSMLELTDGSMQGVQGCNSGISQFEEAAGESLSAWAEREYLEKRPDGYRGPTDIHMKDIRTWRAAEGHEGEQYRYIDEALRLVEEKGPRALLKRAMGNPGKLMAELGADWADAGDGVYVPKHVLEGRGSSPHSTQSAMGGGGHRYGDSR